MSQTNIQMVIGAGVPLPYQVHLYDGSVAYPDAAGKITIPGNCVVPLLSAGWQIVVATGTTHVP